METVACGVGRTTYGGTTVAPRAMRSASRYTRPLASFQAGLPGQTVGVTLNETVEQIGQRGPHLPEIQRTVERQAQMEAVLARGLD